MTRMIWHIWKSCDIYKIDGTRLTQILRMIYTVGIKFYAPCGCFLGRVGRKKCWGKPPKSDGWSSFSPVNMFFDFIPHSLDSHISVDDLIYSALRSRQIFAKKNPQLAKLWGAAGFERWRWVAVLPVWWIVSTYLWWADDGNISPMA